jgi:hypothetical protein
VIGVDGGGDDDVEAPVVHFSRARFCVGAVLCLWTEAILR